MKAKIIIECGGCGRELLSYQHDSADPEPELKATLGHTEERHGKGLPPISYKEARAFLKRLVASHRAQGNESSATWNLQMMPEDEYEVLALDFGRSMQGGEHNGKALLYFDGDRLAFGFTI